MSKYSDMSTPEEWVEASDHIDIKDNAFQNQSQYECLVLSPPVLLPGYTEDLSTVRKYSFQGRIMDEKMTHEKFLRNPCERATASETDKNDKLLCLHTTIEFTAYDGSVPDFSTDDRVVASCLPGNRHTIYNMQYMKFDKTKAVYTSTIADASITCEGYANRDWSGATELGGPDAAPDAGGLASYDALDDSVCEEGYADFFLVHPLQAPSTITSPYGPRPDPMGSGTQSTHHGVDFAASINTPIYAPAAGTVWISAYADTGDNGGNIVVVEHGTVNGKVYRTMGMHLNSFAIANGTQVEAGDLIGKSGNTGGSTGPHLHFTLQVDGAKTDPIAYIKTLQKCGSTEAVASAETMPAEDSTELTDEDMYPTSEQA